MLCEVIEVTPVEIEAACKSWMKWQFDRSWDTASEPMKEKFRDGMRKFLVAAAVAKAAELA